MNVKLMNVNTTHDGYSSRFLSQSFVSIELRKMATLDAVTRPFLYIWLKTGELITAFWMATHDGPVGEAF